MVEDIYLDIDDFLGAIKLEGIWHIVYADLGLWILDYASYDQTYNPSQAQEWRYGYLKVDSDNAQGYYMDYLKANEIYLENVPKVRRKYLNKQAPLTFVVNFDDKVFISAFRDNIMFHEYVPEQWFSTEDVPYNYIPRYLAQLWENS
jgi:hypothetical protein